MKKTINEFKKFAIKGNMIDMAIGIIIGAAFSKIITSFVSDVIMPPIGLLIGGIDFSNLTITLKESVNGAEAVTINYGMFINTVINFIIIAFVIFVVVKQINRFKKEEEKEEKKPSEEVVLLREIRDYLKK